MPGGRVPGRGPPRHRAETGSRGRSLPLSTGTDRGSPGPWGPMSRNQSPVADGLLPTSPWEVLRVVTGWWGLWGSAQGLWQRPTGCAAPGTSHAAGALRSPQEALVQQQQPGTHRGRPRGHRGQRGPRNLPPPSHHSPTPLPPTSDPAILPAPHTWQALSRCVRRDFAGMDMFHQPRNSTWFPWLCKPLAPTTWSTDPDRGIESKLGMSPTPWPNTATPTRRPGPGAGLGEGACFDLETGRFL